MKGDRKLTPTREVCLEELAGSMETRLHWKSSNCWSCRRGELSMVFHRGRFHSVWIQIGYAWGKILC